MNISFAFFRRSHVSAVGDASALRDPQNPTIFTLAALEAPTV